MKKIIFTAIMLSFLLLTACGDYNNSYSSTADYYSSEMPEQLTEDDLLNNKSEISRENNTIVLKGKVVDFEIKDENDAFKAIASLADFMKIRDFNNEIRFESVSSDKFSTTYVFSQYYQDLEVVNTRISLWTDPETNMTEKLFCSYIPIDIDINPEITLPDIEKIIGREYGSELVNKPEPVIYIDDDLPYLAWHITINKEPAEIWLNAKTGDVIYAEYPADWFGGA